MLQRLEFADQLAELLALLEIRHGAAEHLVAQPHHFGGDRAAADIEQIVQQRPAGIDLAEHAVGVDLDIVELDARRVVRVDHDGALGRNALGLGIDQEQRDALGLAGRAAGARGDDQEIGGVTVDHQRLCALQLEAVAGARRLHRGLQRAMFCALVDRQRREQRACGNLRQIFRLLRRAAAARQRRGREHAGREERRRHQGAADLFHDDAGLDAAEPAAAEFFRHQQAGEAHLGKALPELAGEAGGVLAVAQLPQMRHRRLVADEAARAVAQHGLFFGEDEGHG